MATAKDTPGKAGRKAAKRAGRTATAKRVGATAGPVRKSATKQVASKRAPARKGAAKKATAKKAATRRVATKKTAAKKTAVKKAGTQRTGARKASTQETGTRKTTAKKAAATRRTGTGGTQGTTRRAAQGATPRTAKAAKKSSTRRTTRRAPRITPEQALENTRTLLAAKQAKAHETPPWQALGGQPGGGGAGDDAGFQSDEARDRAVGRDQEELRSQGTAGSAGTIDRHNQGRRDSRNDS